MKLSVVIPVYNEKDTLEKIVDLVRAVDGVDKEIIMVDDGSTDGSVEILKKIQEKYPDIKIVFKDKNAGKAIVLELVLSILLVTM